MVVLSACVSTATRVLPMFAWSRMCEGGEGGEGLKWFDMHVIVFVTSRAFK